MADAGFSMTRGQEKGDIAATTPTIFVGDLVVAWDDTAFPNNDADAIAAHIRLFAEYVRENGVTVP